MNKVSPAVAGDEENKVNVKRYGCRELHIVRPLEMYSCLFDRIVAEKGPRRAIRIQ